MNRSFINVLQNFFLIQLDILKQTTSHVLLVAKKKKKSLVCLFHLSSHVRKWAESCKKLHISLPPIFLRLLSVGSYWTTTRAISKVSWCHQDSYWLCGKPPWLPNCWSTCLNYKVSMYLNRENQKNTKIKRAWWGGEKVKCFLQWVGMASGGQNGAAGGIRLERGGKEVMLEKTQCYFVTSVGSFSAPSAKTGTLKNKTRNYTHLIIDII